ncbi:Mitochondrial genome maintenance protein [Escovopsis weberi]|uniref:Mitochondrial genome maintenance protein MGM101 n=1 Tax=Escovopsis weberi TaxID=150374 RepID=A0A0M9VUP8_ESCWE|nr:Mitochondrial genome maintenance protein [Escovopsis weberi]
MFASRRAVSAASRHLSARALRPVQPSARLYSDGTASASATTAPAADSEKPKPAGPSTPSSSSSSSSSSSPPKQSWKSKSAPTGPPLTHDDVVYRAGAIGFQAPVEGPGSGDAPEVPQVNWAQSFHGISARPVTERQFRMLTEPLDEKDIEVKPDGVLYLPEIKYRRKLNEIFGPMGWGIIPKGEAVVGDSIVTREYALIIEGRFVSQAQGENSYFSPEQLPSAVEGCKSNALMRCCKDIGVASELWDPHFVRWFRKTQMEEVWVEHATTKKKRTFWYKKGQVDVAYPYKIAK